MKLCVFGAGGRTGQQVVKQTLQQGYEVRAFVFHNKNNMPAGVEVIQGNIMDSQAVNQALLGVDAVISVVGHVKNSDPLMQTKGMQNIIAAMEEFNIKRIISLTGTGVGLPDDQSSLVDKILNYLIAKLDPQRVNDGIEHVKALQSSGLNWSILRVLKLTNRQKKNIEYSLTQHGPAELFTARAKTAKILVDLLNNNEYIHKMPVSTKIIKK